MPKAKSTRVSDLPVSLPNVSTLRVEQIKEELTKRGITVHSWSKKKTLVALLEKARKRQGMMSTTAPLATASRRGNVPRSDLHVYDSEVNARQSESAQGINPATVSMTSNDPSTNTDLDTSESPNCSAQCTQGPGNISETAQLMAELAQLRKTVEALSAPASARAPEVHPREVNMMGMCQNTQTARVFDLQTAMGPPTSSWTNQMRLPIFNMNNRPNTSTTTYMMPTTLPATTTANHSHCSPLTPAADNGNLTGLSTIVDGFNNLSPHVNANNVNINSCSDNSMLDNMYSMTMPSHQNIAASNLTLNFGGMPNGSQGLGVASDLLPQIDIVSHTVRKDIIAGKNVNLAALLIPGYKSDTLDKHLIKGSEVIALKSATDSRLNKKLSLSEFVLAFATYKNVMCEAYPIRRQELDAYERNIVEMAHKFGGSAFYDYHRAFFARSCSHVAEL